MRFHLLQWKSTSLFGLDFQIVLSSAFYNADEPVVRVIYSSPEIQIDREGG